MIKYEQKLSSQYHESVFTMLAATDEEFVPPISKRASTLQQSFEAAKSRGGVRLAIKKSCIKASDSISIGGFVT